MYRLSTQFKTLYLAAYAASVIIVIGLYMYFLTPGCLVLYLLILGIAQIERHRRALEEEALVISDKTLECRKRGSAFEVEWKNVKELSRVWYLYKQDCLVIDKGFTKIIEYSVFGLPFLHRFLDLQFYLIPLSCFEKNWRDSDLGQQIKRHAPHLFETPQR